MPTMNIDTTSQQYQNLLAGLGTLRTVLAPRIRLLQRANRERQKQWLQRDPLLRRTILMSQKLMNFLDLELDE